MGRAFQSREALVNHRDRAANSAKVLCHTTNTKEMPSFPDGSQIPLIIGRMLRTRIPRNATPFTAIRILRCLRPNRDEMLHLITDGRCLV